jgi:hypothetical protein
MAVSVKKPTKGEPDMAAVFIKPSKETKIVMRKLLGFLGQELPDAITINHKLHEPVEVTVTYMLDAKFVDSLNDLLGYNRGL